MRLTEFDWPPVAFVGTEAETCPRWSGLRELVPLFSRPPYEDWCRLFRQFSEADEVLAWENAGFAHCKPEEIETADERFRAITDRTNEAFRLFLAKVLQRQPDECNDLIALELTLAAEDQGHAYLCGFNSFV